MDQVAIIGAGECGVRAAFSLRERGFDGSVTLIGAESVLPYERPPLSKNLDPAPKLIRTEAAYTEADIELRLATRVVGIDPDNKRVRLAGSATVRYDKLLIATGSRPRILPGLNTCQTLRDLCDAKDIHCRMEAGTRLGIVGGGFIGLELAATARQAGAEVTLVEAGPRLMGRAVPEAIAEVVHSRHLSEGVDVRIGVEVSSADLESIVLSDGTELAFDRVIAGVGVVPNTELAEAAGLKVNNGIVVDHAFRTSVDDIFAAGDCCRFPWRGQSIRLESWRAAQDQGAHVAAAMLGEVAEYQKAPWFWSDQYDLTLQVAGLFAASRLTLVRGSLREPMIVFQCDEDGRVSAVAGVGPGNSVAKDIRIFEKLMERGAKVDAAALADPTASLRELLKAP
jgi:3-phenylpropionate/trans-cinnamate dioxygenase ferredoxin reductase component